jgi:hypothetical protein
VAKINKRQEKKKLKKFKERISTARMTGECLSVLTQSLIYKNPQTVVIETHKPTICRTGMSFTTKCEIHNHIAEYLNKNPD